MSGDQRAKQTEPAEVAAVLPRLIRKTGCDDWRVLPRVIRRRDSTIHFLESATCPTPRIVLKTYWENAVAKNLAHNLHRKSRALHANGTADFTVPQPIMVLKDVNALVMEYIDAPLATVLIKKPFLSSRSRNEITAMAGGWLRWFHGQSEISPEPFQSEIYISTLAKVRDQLQAAAPETFAKDKFLNGYVDQAIRIAAEIEGTLLPHATAHGDFTPSNVFIRGKQVVGFDYAANRRLPVTHDICRFMLYLDVASRLPARARDLGEYGCNPEIYQAFSGRYGIDPELMESGRWIKFQFMEVARRMAAIKLTRARHKGGKNPFRALEMMRLRRNAKQISARITSAG